jgi:Dockerin type I domain/Thrombospondin type 3 repeat
VLLLDLVRIEASATVDSDGDGVPDACDNCSAEPNADQFDRDGDGYGNRCDADIDNSGTVNAVDLARLRQEFGQRGEHLAADLDGNGVVNSLDLAALRRLYGKPPGPSGLVRTR